MSNPRGLLGPRPTVWALFRALLFASVLVAPQLGTVNQAAAADNPEYWVSAYTIQTISAQVGTAFPTTQVRVTKYSDIHTAVAGVTITWTVTPAGNGASATFAGNALSATSVSGNNGVATCPTLTANNTTGSYPMEARATEPFFPNLAIPSNFSLTNIDAAANKVLKISAGDGSLQAAKVNTSYTSPFFAIAFDGNNNLKSGVTVVFTAPSSGPSGVFSDTHTNTTTAVTNGTGVATSATFTANGSAGYYSVDATVDGSQTVDGDPRSTSFGISNSFTDVLGVPYTISVSSGGGGASTNTTFAENMSVVVLDGALAYVPGATVTFTAPASGPSGTFTNGTNTYSTTTNSTGIASAPAFTSNSISGGFSVDVTATKNNVSATTSIAFSVGRVRTITTLAASPSGSSVYGQQTVLTATVTPVEGNAVPSGPVTFNLGGNPISTCTGVTPSGGVATCTLDTGIESTWLTPGQYSFTADYAGDPISTQPSSSTALSYTVNKADTSVSIESSEPAFVLVNNQVTFTVTVSPVSPGRGVPPGTVTMTSSDGTLINGRNSLTLSAGSTQITVTFTQTGDPLISVTYSGNSNFNGSSNSLTQHVYSIPEVTVDPQSATVIVPNQASFTASATGYPVPTVQWQVSTDNGASFTDILGATTTTYSFAPAVSDDQNQYRAVFTNAAGSDTSLAAVLTVRQPPSFTSADSTVFTVGTAGSFQVTVDGYLPPTVSLSGTLPSGVAFDPTTNELSGTPDVGTGGKYVVTLTATNGVDPDATQSFTLEVTEAPLFTSGDSATLTVGTAGSFQMSTSGYPGSTFSTVSTLPSGVTLDSTGLLSGTPGAGTAGIYVLQVVATNSIQPDATQSFTLTVNQRPGFTSADATTFTVGSVGSFEVLVDGYPTPSVSLSGTLPAGVTFDPTTNLLAGTPAVGTGGTYDVTFTATNGVSPDATQSFTLTVNEPPVFTSADSTTFTVGTAGNFQMTASGFPDSIFSTVSALPTGVTLDSTGLLSGTPAIGTAGVYVLQVVATNGIQPDATQSFTLTVNESPSFTSAAATTFTVGSAGSFQVTVHGYPTPTVSLSGSLPSGVTFDPTTNALGGTPAVGTGGTYAVTLTATNGVDPDATQSFTLTVDEPPAFTSADSVVFSVGNAGSLQMAASGYPASTFSTVSALPSGVTFDSAGLLSGTPAVGTSGVYILQVVATNGIQPDATQTFTLTVHRPPSFTSADSTTFTIDAQGTFTVSAESDLAPTLSLSGTLPTGVSFDATTGVLSGTPAHGTVGSYSLTFTATNGINPDAVQSFTLTVARAAGSVSISNLPVTGKVGHDFTPTYTVLGDGTPSVTSLSTSFCTVANGVVSFVGAGTCELQSSVAQGTDYLAADGPVQTVNVVVNSDPVITSFTGPANPVVITASVNVVATFTDVDTLDTHTATIDWGDGTTSTASVSEANGSGSAIASHTYSATGLYTVSVTVADGDGGTAVTTLASQVVINDPTAGFISGYGQFQWSAGSYVANPSLSGTGSFQISSNYMIATGAPNGSTSVQIQTPSLRFSSTSYAWLIVSGSKAMIQGAGTLNGTSGYSFLVSVNDGQTSGGGGVDRFRIKIWNTGTGAVVFDNQLGDENGADPTVAIRSGSITLTHFNLTAIFGGISPIRWQTFWPR